jgi:hypothetical protein
MTPISYSTVDNPIKVLVRNKLKSNSNQENCVLRILSWDDIYSICIKLRRYYINYICKEDPDNYKEKHLLTWIRSISDLELKSIVVLIGLEK